MLGLEVLEHYRVLLVLALDETVQENVRHLLILLQNHKVVEVGREL